MAKPIYITDEVLDKLVNEFREKLQKTRSIEGELTFKTSLNATPASKAVLHFTGTAYLKMIYLVDSFDGEVGWYGLVRRTAANEFEVYDILVYPQSVTGATVTTDEKKLADWDNELSDEVFFARRFQGHSHVDFSPFPSATDIEDRVQKIQQLPEKDFFIFLIINKKREYTAAIYDIENNIQYETDDIDLKVESSMMDFVDSLDLVEEKTFHYQNYYNYGTQYGKDNKQEKQNQQGKQTKQDKEDRKETKMLYGHLEDYYKYGMYDDD